MRLLFDLVHPAHVHLFRHLIARVRANGGRALALTREKEVTVPLCRRYGIPQQVLSRAGGGSKAAGGWELLRRTAGVLAAAARFRPHALLGTSMSIGLVGRLVGRPSLVFNEDDRNAVPLFARLAYPSATFVVTPECLAHEAHGARHLTYPGYHELAYLHPAHFTPDPAVPRSVGIDPDDPFFIVRLVALKAHHDAAARGIGPDGARRLVETLARRGRVLITAEGALRPEFEPYRFPLPPDKLHDVLAFASMYVGDSQTMAAEAAVLGVPALRCNTFVGRISYLEELEHRFGLTRGFTPDRFDDLLALAERWLGDLPNLRATLAARRGRMLAECVDATDWQWNAVRRVVARRFGQAVVAAGGERLG
ncbi:MAG: hypothetical protein HY719_03865 [Planctomycetes bacterium]|nr:hypothetical protein [Planctomycetota bacterium]